MINVPPQAPLVALAFLAASFLIAIGLAGALFGALSKRPRLVARGAALAGVVASAYLIVWTGASLASRETLLATGETKYFCEIDCHLAYSVTGVEQVASLGAGGPAPASGSFLVVTLRTWFDPATISPRRPLDAPLWPNPRNVCAVDAEGRRYRPLPGTSAALARAGRASTPLTEPLRPGESYQTLLVFDVPREARGVKLYVGNHASEGAFLIGHEAAPIAKKAWFSLKVAEAERRETPVEP
ncbi:MAG: hypothetical protein AAB011_02305 [Candidatus Eisenbacteria bacterium]